MTYKNYSFNRSSNIGKVAVDAVTKHLVSRPEHVGISSVEDNPEFQTKGIDIIWVAKVQRAIRKVAIEVKADTYYQTGNLYLETISNTTKQTPGCFVSSCADIYAYFFVGVEVLYWIPLKIAQMWFSEHQERFPVRLTSTGRGGEHFYKTEGRLVPRDILVKEVPGTTIINLGGIK